MFDLLDEIRDSWNEGKVILLHDSAKRTDEVHMIMPAQYTESRHLRRMRREAGGSIEVVVSYDFAKGLGLPLIKVINEGVRTRYSLLDSIIKENYDDHGDTSISFHIRGVTSPETDNNKSMSIQELGELAEDFHHNEKIDYSEAFSKKFTSPGSIRIRVGHHNLLRMKQSHNELGLALTQITNHAPVFAKSTMLGDDGNQLLIDQALDYAEHNKLVIIDGKTVLNLWRSIKKVSKEKILVDEV